MKPRLRKLDDGLWMCSDSRGLGFGKTPAEAYCQYALCVAQMAGFI